MRVLITGGAGYIGSHTARIMSEGGFEVILYDNLSRGNRWSAMWGHLVVGNLADKELLLTTLRNYKIEAVIHFAASAYVGESMQSPGDYFRNNTTNTFVLLDAMREAGVEKIVFSSSCATYGEPNSIPIDEKHPQRPVNPYGESKLMGEKALHWHGVCHGAKWVALRYFNAAGCHPDGVIGEFHSPETHLIPNVINAALGRISQMEVYGTDYPTPDGTAIRDYIHVLDLGDAHVRALKFLQNGGDSGAFNLGTGKGHSIREVISAVEQVSGKRVPVKDCPRRAGDPPVLVADPTLARQILGWRSNHSDLATIIQTAYNWEVSPRRAALSV